MPVEVKIDKQSNCIVIVLPMEKARPSASGKTTLIATSHGLASGEASYSGRPVMVAASAFVYPDELPAVEKSKSREPSARTSDAEPPRRRQRKSKK